MSNEKMLEEIKPFVDACDKMCASKFIMIDKRISDVLKSIASTKPVYDVVRKCMVNFNFDREYKNATAKVGVMFLPENKNKFIAFVFSLLNSMDNRKLNASDILSKYFSKIDNDQSSYAQFCGEVVEPFKQTILSVILNKEEIHVAKEEPEVVVNSEVLSRLEFLTKDLKDYVHGLKKLKKSRLTKGELTEILNGLMMAIREKEIAFIKPFVMAVKAGFGKEKEIERRLFEILDIVNKTLVEA